VAVAEEGEVSVGEPAEQRGALGGLRLVDRRGGLELVGERAGGAGHAVGVLDDLADVVEDGLEGVGDLLLAVRVGDQVHLDGHPRLGQRVRGRVVGLCAGEDVPQLTADHVPADHDDRVDHAVHLQPGPDEGRGHGLHQVGHVVGDQLDDRAGRAPAVGLRVGVDDPDHGPPWHPQLRQVAVAAHDADEVDRIGVVDLLRRDVPVVEADEVRDVRRGRGSLFDELVPALLGALLHRVRSAAAQPGPD
jgi:hypothetical protein